MYSVDINRYRILAYVENKVNRQKHRNIKLKFIFHIHFITKQFSNYVLFDD